MNENINLCEILKGHEGETFYSHTFGKIELINVDKKCCKFLSAYTDFLINKDGMLSEDGELCVFPSKEQRDWNKWVNSNKQKYNSPKIWDDIIKYKNVKDYFLKFYNCVNYEQDAIILSTFEKSVLAFLKIHQLIEVGYGGNACPCHNRYYSICYDFADAEFCVRENEHFIIHDLVVIGFHTPEQAEEFLSYPENVHLLKDYFMIN